MTRCSGDAIDDAILKRHHRHSTFGNPTASHLHFPTPFLHLKCAIRAHLSPRDEKESSGRAEGAI
jgi:hypothetical protein